MRTSWLHFKLNYRIPLLFHLNLLHCFHISFDFVFFSLSLFQTVKTHMPSTMPFGMFCVSLDLLLHLEIVVPIRLHCILWVQRFENILIGKSIGWLTQCQCECEYVCGCVDTGKDGWNEQRENLTVCKEEREIELFICVVVVVVGHTLCLLCSQRNVRRWQW